MAILTHLLHLHQIVQYMHVIVFKIIFWNNITAVTDSLLELPAET